MKPRQQILKFAEYMEIKLQKNDHKRHWSSASNVFLLKAIKKEVQELEDALINGNPMSIMNECADVANFAMMIADNEAED